MKSSAALTTPIAELFGNEKEIAELRKLYADELPAAAAGDSSQAAEQSSAPLQEPAAQESDASQPQAQPL